MMDPSNRSWLSVDWEQELTDTIQEMNKARSKNALREKRVYVGRLIFLMTEYLDPQEWEYILARCDIKTRTAGFYRSIYLLTLQLHLERKFP